jgi:hypothetical protein
MAPTLMQLLEVMMASYLLLEMISALSDFSTILVSKALNPELTVLMENT